MESGYVLWEGKSLLDGKPIIVIGTGFRRSKNRKTGKLIQVWIMRSDINPLEAARYGKDVSICGNCKHRPSSKNNPMGWGTCYVHLGQAPNQVYKAWKLGAYRPLEHADWAEYFAGRRLRLGAYGDPAAVPFEVWQRIVSAADYHTGYTHQWLTCDDRLKDIVMASVDTPEEYERAQRLGWRTFRVRLEDEELNPNERVCPASDEAGNKVDCATCMACHGGGNQKASLAIVIHGGNWKPKQFVQIRIKQRQHKAYSPILERLAERRAYKNRYYKNGIRIDIVRDKKGNVIRMIKTPIALAAGCV